MDLFSECITCYCGPLADGLRKRRFFSDWQRERKVRHLQPQKSSMTASLTLSDGCYAARHASRTHVTHALAFTMINGKSMEY